MTDLKDSNYPEFIKYARIPHIYEVPNMLKGPVEVYEKLDGGNVQVRTHKGRILVANRANYLTDKFVLSKSHIPECKWFRDFLKWSSKNYSFYNLPENKIIFGEWLAKHTLDYLPEFHDKFYLIDIFDINSKRFIPYNESSELVKKLRISDLNFLRALFKGKADMFKLENLVHKSDYRDGPSEGVIIKNYDSQEFAKLWEKSINRKRKPITSDDIRRTIMTMIESGLEINPENVVGEIMLDLTRQRFSHSQSVIENVVRNYFSDPINLL